LKPEEAKKPTNEHKMAEDKITKRQIEKYLKLNKKIK
jgi:hypothetical protein